VSVWPIRHTGTMGWLPTWLDLMPSIPSSSFQVSLSSFDPFKCTFWARTDKRTDGQMDTQTHTHTHTQNLYILALRAVNRTIIALYDTKLWSDWTETKETKSHTAPQLVMSEQ